MREEEKKNDGALSAADRQVASLRAQFRKEVQEFLDASGVPNQSSLRFHPEMAQAEPVYLVTGATFTPYSKNAHGDNPAHAFYGSKTGGCNRYLMNNTAALLERLMNEGHRVLVHSGNPDLVRELVKHHPNGTKVNVVVGDLAGPDILKTIYSALEDMDKIQPVSTVRMALYQSFAQSNGDPFKPLHRESVEEVERAASKRIRFVFNMAAMGYDFIVNRNLEDLRIASLSALASNRASYGLLADAADKFMNELVWRTFHLEANISTGKPVTLYQINPGITTACDVYQRESVRELVIRESIADGFPLDNKILSGQEPLPSLSARDVAWVADALLSTPYNDNPNADMPDSVRNLLYGGFTPDVLKDRFEQAVKPTEQGVSVDPDRLFPDHILRSSTEYGALPSSIKPGEFRRISLCPPGQKF